MQRDRRGALEQEEIAALRVRGRIGAVLEPAVGVKRDAAGRGDADGLQLQKGGLSCGTSETEVGTKQG